MHGVENRWCQILAAAVDGAVVESGTGSTQADLSIRTRDGRAIAIGVKWAGEGWPQDVRGVARDVPAPWPHDVVVLARRLSPGAIEWLRERGANWADEAGQVRILGPDGLIVIREPARVGPMDRSAGSFRWSPSALTVAEAILSRPDGPLRATDLASASGWSVPQTANVLKAFDAQGWTIKRGSARGPDARRELIDADALLADWSSGVAQAPRRTRVAHRATRDVLALLREQLVPTLDRNLRWALSGWAALELAAPIATTTPSLHVYVAENDFAGPLSDAIERAGLRELDEGGRVTFWATDARTLAFATRHEGIQIVSPPRLFADLTALGGRGQDAADHVKALLIDPLHPPTDSERNG